MARPVARGGLDTHIRDVLGVVEFEDLHGMVLNGHSYGTLAITGVADRVPVAITISSVTASASAPMRAWPQRGREEGWGGRPKTLADAQQREPARTLSAGGDTDIVTICATPGISQAA